MFIFVLLSAMIYGHRVYSHRPYIPMNRHIPIRHVPMVPIHGHKQMHMLEDDIVSHMHMPSPVFSHGYRSIYKPKYMSGLAHSSILGAEYGENRHAMYRPKYYY